MIILKGIDKGISNDILAMEIRQTLHHLGEIIRRWADRQVKLPVMKYPAECTVHSVLECSQLNLLNTD
jgi:hypothetical protein